MRFEFAERFRTSYSTAPDRVRRAFRKQLRHLALDLRHPSLRAKKYDEARDVWQARVDRNWRFYFVLDGDTCFVIDIVPHPK